MSDRVLTISPDAGLYLLHLSPEAAVSTLKLGPLPLQEEYNHGHNA